MAYNVSNKYIEKIYSGDSRHKIKILFDNVELEDANIYVEKLTVKSRILKNGSKIFSLGDFVSKEATLILHDLDLSIIKDSVNISIGTLIDEDNNTYEYVPIGIFNIQDEPTTDKNKITLKLRDNSVKFDFYYDAKSLIDENEGTATKKQIFQDICSKAGVNTKVISFYGEDDEIGIYDNTITGRIYISYIAEQCGAFPTIDRDGELIFVYINDLKTNIIPRELLEKYTNSTSYKITRVVYESGITKYEQGTDDNDILYLNSANPYINNQEQVDYIYSIVNGFEINSFSTGKILGNPAIDSYDLISATDGDKTFITLGNNDFTFNGVMIMTFDTNISKEKRKENVTKVSDKTFKNWATTEINNATAEVKIAVGQVESLDTEVNNNYQEIINKFGEYAPQNSVDEVQTSVEQLTTNTYTKTEIQQIASGVGVDGVKVTAVISASATFDENGMHYEKTDAPTSTTINEVGVKVDDATGSGNELLFAGYDEDIQQTIVRTDNLTVRKYFVLGENSRMEDYEDGGGIFVL